MSHTDVNLAFADRLLFEAELSRFYGSLTFQFKAGKIILVRREETVIPQTPTDEPNGFEALGDLSCADDQNGVRHHR